MITVSKFELLRELSASQGVVQDKTTIPILANYLIKAFDETLSITVTDLEIAMQSSCSAIVTEPLTCTVPAKRFYDYIKLLPDADITLKQNTENKRIDVRCGRSSVRLVGMAADSYPKIPDFPELDAVRIPTAALLGLINRTMFVVSDEISKYVINGALLVFKPESVMMVATDGHRLAVCEKNDPTDVVGVEMRTLIPKKALREVKVMLESTDSEFVDFAKTESKLFFRAGGRTLTSAVLTGKFPGYEAVLPKDAAKFITLNTADLNTAIQRVAQFADERSGGVKFSLSKNTLRLSAESSGAGDSIDELDCIYDGEDTFVKFNANYFVDFLKASAVGEVQLVLKDAKSAGELRPVEGDEFNYRYVVMPMRN